LSSRTSCELTISDQHFYQLGLRQFGALDRLKLDPPPDLRDLLEIGLQDEPLSAHGLELDDVATVRNDFCSVRLDLQCDECG
jgi:DNA mismatch repair protein MLH1